MGIAARELRLYVIRPTLLYLGRHSQCAEALLLGIAASQSDLGSALHNRGGHGLYRIGERRHAELWDHYLAWTRNWPAWFVAWPASTPFSAARTSN